jgi:catechol 2,3-dioxygenase-like lactoylglutathione lyase family enzyme
VVVVRDLEASLRFYRDGLGLDLLQDRQIEGNWPDLFDAPSRRVRAVFLGDAGVPDDHAGVLELNVFDGDVPMGPPPSPPRTGLRLLHGALTPTPGRVIPRHGDRIIMIRHMVLFTLRDDVPYDDPRVQRACAAEEMLATRVPAARSWRFGANLAGRHDAADFAGTGDFESVSEIRAFLEHPAHLEAVGLCEGVARWLVADIDLT